MYPLQQQADWSREQWYAAGWSSEFAETPIERMILNQRLLLFRNSAGAPVALSGLCPHRFMPLVQGKRQDDTIECPYHGMSWDSEGTCTIGPAGLPPVATGRLRRYPTHELDDMVWVWTGDGEPDQQFFERLKYAGIGADGWESVSGGMHRFEARYMLVIDNLFDLSHIAWVHESLIGKPAYVLAKPTFEEGDDYIHFERRAVIPTPPTAKMFHPNCVGPMEVSIGTRMLSPAVVTAIGPDYAEGEGSPMAGHEWGCVQFVHCVTPETKHTTNVFIIVTRNFRLGDPHLPMGLKHQAGAVVAQDCAATALIEQALAQGDLAREMSFRTDQGGIAARRRIDAMIAQEAVAQRTAA